MMGPWGYAGMGDNWATFGVLGLIFWAVLLVDFVLLGIWLWKQIQKK